MNRPLKILIAKPGLDGHDRGAKIIAHAFRDAGMEVIYTGLRQTPGRIAAAAIQEDVDVIGLSILSGVHLGMIRRLREELKKRNAEGDFLIILGGSIPAEDIPILKNMGVAEVFTSDCHVKDIVQRVQDMGRKAVYQAKQNLG